MAFGIKLFLLLPVIVFSWALVEKPVFAAQENQLLQEGSLAISPFLIETDAKPGATTRHSIEVFNSSNVPQRLSFSIQDFTADGVSGAVRFLPVGQANHPQYSLVSWLSVVEQPDFAVPANGSTSVEFTITPPLDATAGSHYGGLLFSFDEPDASEANISVSRKLGALVIVRLGRGRVSGEMHVSAPKTASALPLPVTTVFHNTGSVHLAPKGEHYFYNMFGNLAATVPINRDANIVLPEQRREFTGSLDKWLFGRYKLVTMMYYGSEPKLEARSEQIIWIVPWQKVVRTGIIILIIILALYLLLRKYNRFIIRRNRD